MAGGATPSRTIAVVVAVLVAVSGMAACSGSDEPAATDATVPSTSNTAAATLTTTRSTTTNSTSTSTTSPSTTEPAPTTTALDDPARLRAAEEGYIASWNAYHAAILGPGNPALRAEVERTTTGGNRVANLKTLDDFAAANYVARPNPDVPAKTEIVQPALPIPDDTERVDMVVCETNSESYWEVGSRPDGGDALVRDEVFVLRILVRMRFVDGLWRLESGSPLTPESGGVSCSA